MTATIAVSVRPTSLGRAHRLTSADYHRMGEIGILGPELRTELIDGEIIEMPPIGHPHAGTLDLIADRLGDAVGRRALLRVQGPIRLDDYSEPLPDLALLRPRPDYYRNAHPVPNDVLLLIEVADSSLAYDRDVKLPRYALAGIPEVWLVDLRGRRLLIHRRPEAGRWGEKETVSDLTKVAVPVSGGQSVLVDLNDLF
jgi:Uma2 family endonuclease